MRMPRPRFSVRGLMLAAAVAAVPLSWVAERIGDRRTRCLEIADRHARLAAEYRKNARGAAMMVRIADWNDYMVRRFINAADETWGPIPKSMPFPPQGWAPPR